MSEKMIFCLGEGRHESKGEGYQKNYRAFNKDVSQDRYSELRELIRNTIFSGLKLHITKWIKEENMAGDEKVKHEKFHITKGYLKRQSYEDAWEEMWSEVNDKNKQKLIELPEFDAQIFAEITGIDIGKEDDEVTIVVEGKEKKISRKSAKALNLI